VNRWSSTFAKLKGPYLLDIPLIEHMFLFFLLICCRRGVHLKVSKNEIMVTVHPIAINIDMLLERAGVLP